MKHLRHDSVVQTYYFYETNVFLFLSIRLNHTEKRVQSIKLIVVGSIAIEVQELGAHIAIVFTLCVEAVLNVLSIRSKNCFHIHKKVNNNKYI